MSGRGQRLERHVLFSRGIVQPRLFAARVFHVVSCKRAAWSGQSGLLLRMFVGACTLACTWNLQSPDQCDGNRSMYHPILALPSCRRLLHETTKSWGWKRALNEIVSG